MAQLHSHWMVILRCYKCGALFTLKGIPAIAIQAASDSSHCPKCGSKKLPGVPRQKTHMVVNLIKPDQEY